MKKDKEKNKFKTRLLTVEETANYLNISTQHIYNSLSRGTFSIKPCRIGRAIRFDSKKLDEFIEEGDAA